MLFVQKWSHNQKQTEAQIEGSGVVNKWEEITAHWIPAGTDELPDSVISSIKRAREAPITSVDNEHESFRTQGVVQRDHYHGVGVAGQFTDNPLRHRETAFTVRSSKPKNTSCYPVSNVHTHLGSVLSKDANKSVSVWLQSLMKKSWPQVLRSIRHLHIQEEE